MATGFHTDKRYKRHEVPHDNPERPERIDVLLDVAEGLDVVTVNTDRRASADELGAIHNPEHIEAMAATAGKPSMSLDWDTHTSAESYDLALQAAGAALEMVDRVMAGELSNGFVAARPPGHHAERDRAMGFCLFNNVAVAGRHLLDHHGLDRVLILDWDVHHGNGTQNSFYTDERVLFVSMHQHPLYPGTGSVEEVGLAQAAGRTVNVPMPAGCDDGDYGAVLTRVVNPIVRAFSPQFILVSAGFDAHADDPLGSMDVSTDGFARMAEVMHRHAAEHCDGRYVMLLEGGYSVEALRDSTRAVLEVMGGKHAPEVAAGARHAMPIIAEVRASQSEYWPLSD
jgi:acetoin utilization deacetylase AcuC-like enzyme